MSSTATNDIRATEKKYEECLSCKIIGTGALAGVGIYALNQSRAHQPGTVQGRRVMAVLGVCFIGASYFRWHMSSFQKNQQ